MRVGHVDSGSSDAVLDISGHVVDAVSFQLLNVLVIEVLTGGVEQIVSVEIFLSLNGESNS